MTLPACFRPRMGMSVMFPRILTAELAGITEISEEEAWLCAQAWRFEQTFEAKAEQHFDNRLVENERHVAEEMRQEVGANHAKIECAFEAAVASNVQLVSQGNIAFEQRHGALRQTVFEGSEGHRAHIAGEVQEDIPAYVEASNAEGRDLFGMQFGKGDAGVSCVAHAEVQFLCQEWTVHGWCDIKHVEGYTIASNTSKCKAVEFMSELAIRIGNVNCTFKSCDVPPLFVNTLQSSVERYFLDTVTCSCKCGYSIHELHYCKQGIFSGCMSDCIHDVAHLVSLPINSILEDAPIAMTIEFPDDVVFVDGDWKKNSAVLEQKDLFGAVSVFVADDAVPNSEVLKVAETETVEGEVVVDFPAMDADGKNEASLRKVAIDEVLVPEVGVPQSDWFFDRFRQSSGRRRLVSTPLWSVRSPMCPLWLTIGKAATRG